MEADVLGRLPIHYACSNGAPLDVVRMLLKSNSSTVLYADYNGWIPLHVAVHFGAETDVVRELIRVCPVNVLSVKTRKGSTALCLAKKVTTKNKEEVVKLLEDVTSEHGIKTPSSHQLIDLLDCDVSGGLEKESASSNVARRYPFAA